MVLAEILEVLDAGGTLVLAVVAIFKMHGIQSAMETLTTQVLALMTKDATVRTEQALDLGKSIGHIETQLDELVLASREDRRARGSDTRHPPARREDYPSDRGNGF